MDGQETIAQYAARVSSSKAAPAPTPVAPQPVPYVNPSNLAQQSLANYAATMQRGGYTQTSEQAGGVVEKAQQEAVNTNLALTKDEYNRQQETLEQAKRANQSYAINQGLGEVKTRPPEGEMERAKNIDEAFVAMDDMSNHWKAAAQGINWGGPIKGSIANPWDTNQKMYWQSQQLAATSIANGILPYTNGADTKKPVQEQMKADSPNQYDTPQMASGKMVGLMQKGMNGALALRRELQDNNFSTTHIDDIIQSRAPLLQKAQDWYDQMNPKTTNNVAPGTGSTFSPEAQARLNQISGSPNNGTISSSSPSPQNPPPPANQPVAANQSNTWPMQ